jgi:lipoprotein-releasing system permease protein
MSRRHRGLVEMGIAIALLLAGIAVNVKLVATSDLLVTVWPVLLPLLLLAHGLHLVLPEPKSSVEDRGGSLDERRRALIWIGAGVVVLVAGWIASALVYEGPDAEVVELTVAVLPALIAGALFVVGFIFLRPIGDASRSALEYLPGVGYRTFVAWRYLLDRRRWISLRTKVALALLVGLRVLLWLGFGVGVRPDADPLHLVAAGLTISVLVVLVGGVLRHSRLGLIVFGLGLSVSVVMFVVLRLTLLAVLASPLPKLELEAVRNMVIVFAVVISAGVLLAILALFFGSLRGVFTFFTTVPIGGVWIGTMALVIVLAVMSGFETDLRDKILGSNAHIQVSKEDGEFVEWREVKAKLDKLPGVVASTPFATSEVVIAANNNGMNVIIKGIDPATVGEVTNLIKNLEDREAITRLAPLVEIHDRTTPEQQRPGGDILDPPPDDMPLGGDPIDFSGEPDPDDSPEPEPPPPPPAPDPRPSGDDDTARVSPYGGDAVRVIDFAGGRDADVLDSDLVRWATGSDDPDGEPIPVIDIVREPSLSRRTLALPGILVGRELVKQTHLYTGEEVRVVSPLSDPSNPDATGTPIPFNRDYRVAGVFYTGMYEYDLKYVYVTLESLQDFLDLGDTVDGIEVRVRSADDTDRYVPGPGFDGLIREALGPGYRVQDWRELNRSLFSALKLEKIAMFLVLGIVILVASFSIIGNLIMVVVEKAREIALLKTLGASDLGVMQLFAIQGLIIGLIGTALGVSTGLAACWALDKFGLPLDPDVYYINRLPIHIDPESVIAAALTGVLISIGATLYPALLAARVRPAAGMRH